MRSNTAELSALTLELELNVPNTSHMLARLFPCRNREHAYGTDGSSVSSASARLLAAYAGFMMHYSCLSLMPLVRYSSCTPYAFASSLCYGCAKV